jgi:two-component system sensor histidine kinase DegS
MTGQLQSLSIIEERSRIAREMHDGLAQVLGYLNLQVQTIERLFKQKKHKAMEEEIAHMRTSVLQAQDDIRENILSLRTTLANEQGVVPSIEEYLREFSIQTGIQTTFENETGTLAEDGLSSIVEVQLVCILQEALTNVRKHSHASEVIVELSKIDQQDQSKVMLMVRDDGIGFELKQKRKTFGLQTMQERAVSVNADFSIWSKVNQGTKVTCVFPLVEEKAKTTKVSIFN